MDLLHYLTIALSDYRTHLQLRDSAGLGSCVNPTGFAVSAPSIRGREHLHRYSIVKLVRCCERDYSAVISHCQAATNLPIPNLLIYLFPALLLQLTRAIGAARRLEGNRRDTIRAVLRRGRGSRSRDGLLLHRIHRLHHQEHGKGHDEEGEDGIDEDTDVDRRDACLLRGLQRGEGARLERNEPVGKIDAARQ